MQQVSQRTIKLSLSGALLALLVLLTFNVGTTYAAVGPCGSVISVTSGSSGSCTLTNNFVALPGALTYTTDPGLAISSYTGTPLSGSTNGTISGTGSSIDPYKYNLNGTNQTFNIAFGTTVSDGRGGSSGWSLAASTNLPANFVTLTGATASCDTNSDCFPAATNLTQNFPRPLSSIAQTFITAPNSVALANGGDYSIATVGTLTVPSNIPAGANITGSLTITLNDLNS